MKTTLNWGARLLTVLLLFSVMSCMLPYAGALQQAEDQYEQLVQEGWDIVLDPIELVPETGKVAALNSNTGSWSPVYMGTNDRVLLDTLKARNTRGATKKVHVYIIDTAPDGRHPALKDITTTNKIFVIGEDGKDGDSNGHGTHCGGIVAGIYPGKNIPIGVAAPLRPYDLIELHFVQALQDNGSGAFSWVGQGIDWAISDSKEERARGEKVIISMSLGGATSTTMLDPHMQRAQAAGAIVVAANGNTGRTPLNYPGKSKYSQGIASLQRSGSGVTRSGFSSYGPETIFSAPGSSVYSSYKTNGWATLSGTSMATPAAAGALAFIWAMNPNATNEQLLMTFMSKAFDLGEKGHDHYYGYGAPILTRMIAPIGGGTPPPDDDPTPPNPDPDPTPDPDPDPAPSPKLPELQKEVETTYLSKPHQVRIQWRNRGEGIPDTSFNFTFKVQTKLKSKSKEPEKLIEEKLSNYFNGRRGIVLPGGPKSDMDTKKKTAYYVVVFLELELIRKQKLKFDVDYIIESPNGIVVPHRELPKIREEESESKVNAKLDKAKVYTYIIEN